MKTGLVGGIRGSKNPKHVLPHFCVDFLNSSLIKKFTLNVEQGYPNKKVKVGVKTSYRFYAADT